MVDLAHDVRRSRYGHNRVGAFLPQASHIATDTGLWTRSFDLFWQMCQSGTSFWLGIFVPSASTGQGVVLAPTNSDTSLNWAYEAIAEAAAGRLDAAYDIALLQLDTLLSEKKWDDAARALDVIVGDDVDVDLGLGAMRFASFAQDEIVDWSELIARLEDKLEARGESAAVAMRGLI